MVSNKYLKRLWYCWRVVDGFQDADVSHKQKLSSFSAEHKNANHFINLASLNLFQTTTKAWTRPKHTAKMTKVSVRLFYTRRFICSTETFWSGLLSQVKSFAEPNKGHNECFAWKNRFIIVLNYLLRRLWVSNPHRAAFQLAIDNERRQAN